MLLMAAGNYTSKSLLYCSGKKISFKKVSAQNVGKIRCNNLVSKLTNYEAVRI